MDKNTIIGFLLIILIFIGFSYLNRPTPEQIETQKRYNDSITAVQQEMINQQIEEAQAQAQTLQTETENLPDSVKQQKLRNAYGNFAPATQGEEQLITLENDLLKISLTTQGGRIYSAQLKNYSNHNQEPLFLFERDESSFGITFITANNRVLNTSDFYFDVIQSSALQTTLRLKAGDSGSLDLVYTLHPNDYMVDFEIFNKNLETELSPAMRTLDFRWTQKIRQQEKGRKYEDRYAYLSYKYLSDDVEHLRETKDDIKNIANKIKWIGYKDQFFSSVLIAKESFESTKLESKYFNEGLYLKEYTALTSVPFAYNSTEGIKFNYYFGPNDYTLLKNYDKTKFEGQNLELEKLVPLGWSLFRYVNKWVIIPIFDWLTGWCGSLGLAIFLLTLIIKSALFPLTYKSFMSSAKMRVLRPQTEQIAAKYPGKENAMVRQQKNMELYRQVGVNPMAGCMPMLLQMPFLLALFMFFPSAIELRHQSFLWANDLSTYDDLIQWDTYIPIVSPYFGNHVSIFCLLMTIVNIFYQKYSMEQTNTGQEQMPGMKTMMYIMPVFMLVFLNSYPDGLNYYYFISTLITIVQTIAFRFFLNEEKLLAKLEANKGKAKPAKKKSGFMARLEEAQRKQQALMREQQKNRRR
ncbi:MAG: membrane protein insertase YidC [Dysgonamonadaceae bacterium]|jgi:YidC/Oxa1 family membrane protein insertase|nr:membrane protein insertase YidC [Dysgonamonadaceae bacterium]